MQILVQEVCTGAWECAFPMSTEVILLLQIGRPAQVDGTGTKLKRNRLEYGALSGDVVPALTVFGDTWCDIVWFMLLSLPPHYKVNPYTQTWGLKPVGNQHTMQW